MRTSFLIGLLLFPGVLLAQKPPDGGGGQEESKAAGLRFKIKDGPSLRIGENFRLDVRAKWHFDYASRSPSLRTEPDSKYSLTRARMGIKGKVAKYFEYEVEREFRGTFGDDHPSHPWKDVYVRFEPFDFGRLKVGKFKIPIGMEENTSEDSLDFINRSRTTEYLAAARERGAMLSGKFLKGKRIEYEVGVFRYDGENAGIGGLPTAGRTYVARVSGEPLRYAKRLPKTIRHTYLGVAASNSRLFEGQNSIRGKTLSDLTYFDSVWVKGYRRRSGVELAWSEGPFALKSEYIRVSEQRKEQSVRGNNLPDKISRGWYVSGAWVAYGKIKEGEPKEPLFTGHGFGAVELAARLDVLTFYSAERSALPSPSPRAANLALNGDRTWTFGATWFLNHFMKLQVNADREWVANSERRDFEQEHVDGDNPFWTTTVRLQFRM